MREPTSYPGPFSKKQSARAPRRRHALAGTGVLGAMVMLGAAAACGAPGADDTAPEKAASTRAALSSTGTPVGLALDIDNGVGTPLSVRAGQTFYINQIDVRASQVSAGDNGVQDLATNSDFAGFDWSGVHEVDEAPVLLANADGTYTRRRFYRFAKWMNGENHFTVEQIDGSGHVVGDPVTVKAGSDFRPKDSDDYWDRRYRAIQWTRDCVAQNDCTGAKVFDAEALVELRYAQHPDKTFVMQPGTVALRVRWSLKKGATYTIPVNQVSEPQYDYGFAIDIEPLTPPNADGTYSPGTDITFRATLRDGSGNRLHPQGQMPSYNEVIFGSNPAGIQYYRAFFDTTMTYYRRKHRERNMMVSFLGPAQNAQPIRHLAPLDEFLGPADVQDIANFADDGVYAQFKLFPTSHDLFGGAFDPAHAAWNNPVSDTWTNHVPADAVPGTYFVTMKGRRVYLGQDIPFTRTVDVQVGTTQKTQATLHTGGCKSCHDGQSSLNNILHANSDRATCAACHTPLGFEYEGPIYVRTHFIHSRSTRFDEPKTKCATCHTDEEGIQRTSQSACMSCHKSYDAWHVKEFGPITYMYTGGGPTSFQQCTSSCHTNHPGSGL